jgi:hypothetical protein
MIIGGFTKIIGGLTNIIVMVTKIIGVLENAIETDVEITGALATFKILDCKFYY